MSKASAEFEKHLLALRTDAEGKGVHFSDSLMCALDNSDTPTHVKLANLLMKPDGRVPHLINRYRVEYFEWLANQALDQREARKSGGKKRGAQMIRESLARQNKILEKEAELLAIGSKL